MFLLRPVLELIDRIVCIVAAIALAQAPLYIEQYVHVLSGALAEAKIAYTDLEKRAASLMPPLSVEEFISHHLQSEDEVFQASGKHFQEQVLRYENYQLAYEKLTTCSLLQKPFVFLQYKNDALLQALDFKPGFPFSTEGLVYGLIGALLGFVLVSAIRALGRKLLKSPKTGEIK